MSEKTEQKKKINNNKKSILSDKQRLFITEYLKDFNATQAAIRAGYSKATANRIASENLSKPDIKFELNKQIDLLLADNKDIALSVVRECQKIAFAKITDFVEFDNDGLVLKSSDDVDGSVLESISFDETITQSGMSTKKRVKLHDKLKALEILSKYTGLYKETPIDININIEESKKEIQSLFGVEVESPETE